MADYPPRPLGERPPGPGIPPIPPPAIQPPDANFSEVALPVPPKRELNGSGHPLSREELLKQAAQAPTSHFILPTAPLVTEDEPEPEAPVPAYPFPPSSVPQPAPHQPMPAPIPPPPRPPAAGLPHQPAKPSPSPFPPIPGQRQATPIPPASHSMPQPAPHSAPQPAHPFAPPAKPATPNYAIATSPHDQHHPAADQPFHPLIPHPPDHEGQAAEHFEQRGGGSCISVFGLLAILVIVGGISYLLVQRGLRLPYIYPVITGLKVEGVALSQEVGDLVKTRKSYQQTGETKISLIPAEASEGETPPVVTSKLETASPGIHEVRIDNWTGVFAITSGEKPATTLYAKTGAQGSPVWMMRQPGGSQVEVSNPVLQQSLLYPLLRPIPLPALLAAAKSEKGYAKKTIAGQDASEYEYEFDGAALATFFPEGAQVKSLSGKVTFVWHTKDPLAVNLTGSFSLDAENYSYASNWNYQKWDIPLASEADADLRALLEATPDTEATSQTAAQIINQLGISFATTPGVVAVVPSGQGITEVVTPITKLPPLPPTPASQEAKNRDIQRKKDLVDLKNALENYKTKQGSYPVASKLEQTRSSPTLLAALVPTYLTKMPVDPIPEIYWYEYESDGSTYTLRAIAENTTDPQAKKGKFYYYFWTTPTTQ